MARKKKWWLARSAGHVDHARIVNGIARATRTREVKTKRYLSVQVQEQPDEIAVVCSLQPQEPI